MEEEGGENEATNKTILLTPEDCLLIEMNASSSSSEEDRISLLPDCLLIEIISRLPETKHAIRTGTLSKRWQHLWPYVSNLSFEFHMSSFKCDHQTRLSDFASFVDKTLFTQWCQFNLAKFKLVVTYDTTTHFESHVNNWLRYAFTSNVQDLELFLSNMRIVPEFVLDEFFFRNSSFTLLRLEGCVFKFKHKRAGAVSWKNLKSLFIADGKLKDGLIESIVSGSPLLETLSLVRCYGFERVDVTSKSVKKLVIGGYSDPEFEFGRLRIVEINAPHIISLQIISEFSLWKLELLDVSSLVEAELDYEKDSLCGITIEDEQEEMLEDLILSLRHVKKLLIGYNCLETLGHLKAKGFSFPSNLEHPDWSDSSDYDIYSSGSEDE